VSCVAAEVGSEVVERARPDRVVVVVSIARWRAQDIVAALLAVAQLTWFGIELLRGFFWQDDFVFFYLGATQPPGTHLLLRNYNGHVQPGAFLVGWLLARIAPLNHPAAVLVVVLLQAAILLLCWRLLVRLFGHRWAVLVPFAVVAFSPITFVMSMWWAYALQLLPLVLALFGALNAHVAHLQRPSSWRAAQSLLFVAFGLAFWEKAVLIQPIIVGLTLVLADGGLAGRLRATLRGHPWLWLAHGLVFAGYALVHLVYAPMEDSPRPTVGDLGTLVRNMIGDTLLPAAYGGPWNGDWVGLAGLAPPPLHVLVIAWTASAAVVLAGLWRNRLRAAVAWTVLAGYLAVSVGLVAFTRLGPFGALIGTDPRYIADALPVAAVFAALAVLPPRARAAEPEPPRSWSASLTRVAVPLALVLALGVGAALSIAGAVPQERHLAARDYVENVRAAYALEPDLMLYDTPVSPEVLVALFGDNAMASRVFAPLGFPFDRPTDELRMLDNGGTPRRIGLVEAVGSQPGPVKDCGYLLQADTSTRVPLTARTAGRRRVMEIGYYSQHGSDGKVALPAQEIPVHFQAGVHHMYLVVDGGFDELLIRAQNPVCVTDVLVGAPLPYMN